ncbi:MAG: S1 family peptidase [Candidatus Thorarchaeota archaeon]|jgi:S1-C subfamily serine protease
MRHFLPIIVTLSIVFHTCICCAEDTRPKIVENVYSSVVIITRSEFKTSIVDALGFAALVAGTVFGTGGVGYLVPGHIEKEIGTGFQTQWGIVTNSHVMEDKPRATLTTFHNKFYSIEKINKIECENQHVSIQKVKIVQPTAEEQWLYGDDDLETSSDSVSEQVYEEATVFDWGGLNVDLALIRVKVPDAVELPLAGEVDVGEKVFTLGHPGGNEYKPAVGSVKSIFTRKGVRLIQLQIEHAQGSSGSPVLNTAGEVVGAVWGGYKSQGIAEAVHVDELRKAFGLPVYGGQDKEYNAESARGYRKEKDTTTSSMRGVLAEKVINESIRQDLSLEPDDRIINITSAPFTSDIDTKEEFWSAWGRIDRNKTCRLLIKRGKNYYDVKFVPDPLTVVKKAPQVMVPWNGPVYCTQQSRLFHRPDCDELITGDDLMEFASRESAILASGTACSVCNP